MGEIEDDDVPMRSGGNSIVAQWMRSPAKDPLYRPVNSLYPRNERLSGRVITIGWPLDQNSLVSTVLPVKSPDRDRSPHPAAGPRHL
jgi:hypothetical protein